MSEYDDLVKEYRKMAKKADQRLVRLEGYSYRTGFKTATKWAYSRAMEDIKHWSGEESKRFNTKPPKDIKQLKAKIADIETFLQSPSSTMSGIIKIYKKKADTINQNYGTIFTWEDLAKYYMLGTADKLDASYGSKTALKTIAQIQKNKEDIVKQIEEGKKTMQVVEDKIINKTINKILNDSNLDISMFYD